MGYDYNQHIHRGWLLKKGRTSLSPCFLPHSCDSACTELSQLAGVHGMQRQAATPRQPIAANGTKQGSITRAELQIYMKRVRGNSVPMATSALATVDQTPRPR